MAVIFFLLALCLQYHQGAPLKITLTSVQIQDYVDRHNYLRASRCVQNLGWDDTLAKVADYSASRCTFSHSNGTLREQLYIQYLNEAGLPIPTITSVGENLASAWGAGLTPPYVDMDQWSDEINYYTCSTGACDPSKQCGHYTQQVWQNTTLMGCAKYQCDANPPGGTVPWFYLVCVYNSFQSSARPFPVSGCDCTPPPTHAPTAAPTSPTMPTKQPTSHASMIVSNLIVVVGFMSLIL